MEDRKERELAWAMRHLPASVAFQETRPTDGRKDGNILFHDKGRPGRVSLPPWLVKALKARGYLSFRLPPRGMGPGKWWELSPKGLAVRRALLLGRA